MRYEVIQLYIHLIALSNNPLVCQNFHDKLDVIFIDGNYIDVLTKARDLVHKGFNLITHPLMGSIKPNETPYRSLILQQGEKLDLKSLEVIEQSIETCKKFLSDKPAPNWDKRVLEDFQFVDNRLFESAFESLK